MKFKTYGAVFDSLKKDLIVVGNQAYKDYYGTPTYFHDRTLMIHRAYQDWCYVNGLVDIAELRIALAKEYESFPRIYIFDDLFYVLPNEFNVRGVWTPE